MKIRFALLAALILCLSACSTTRVLQPGQYRLKSNKVKVTNAPQFSTSQITPYIKQQVSSGWSPLMSIYNWQTPGSDDFISRFARKVGVAPVVYNASLLPSSIENIDKHLVYLGYYNSQIATRVDTVKRNVVVNYEIELGRRYRIDSVFYSIPDDGDFRQEFYADTASSLVRPGIYLSESLLEQESARGAAYFRDLGYYDFNKSFYTFVADTLNHADSTILEYRIERFSRNAGEATAKPLRKYTIGDVRISRSANIPFRDKVLTDLNTVKPGQIYSESEINKTYTRLSQLKLFNSIRMELEPQDSQRVSCDIRLSESRQRGFKVQLEASSNSSGLIGISPQLSFFHKNLFHGGEWLNLGFSGNFQTMIGNRDVHSTEFSAASSLSVPRILGIPNRVFRSAYIPRTEISLSGSYQDRSEYKRSIASLSLGLVGNLNKELYYSITPFQFKYVNVAADPAFILQLIEKDNLYLLRTFESHVDAGVGVSLQYITNTDIVPKTPYHYIKLSLNSSGNVLSLFKNSFRYDEDLRERVVLGVPFSQYVRGELTLGRTLRFGRNDNQALAMRLLAGAGFAYGNSSALPFEQQFYVGGSNSLRGWQIRSIGPGFANASQYFTIPSQTGDLRLEANLEYRFPLFWKLEGALFAEAGNIWMLSHSAFPEWDNEWEFFHFSDFYKSLAADWGLGLRVNLDFILLRLDAGVKVHDPSRPEGQRWIGSDQWLQRNGFAIHFGVGYPF